MNHDALPGVSLQRTREAFFAGDGLEPDALPPHIERSWTRCLSALPAHQCDPEPLGRDTLFERRTASRQMLQCAQPELDGLAEHVTRHGCVVLISDGSGLILDELGSPDFLPRAQRLALAPGVAWSEEGRGTNAIGTALMERAALTVRGDEHYLSENAGLGCAAAPIFDGRGGVLGVLDVSGESLHVDEHALGLVTLATQQIEHRLLLARACGPLLRFHTRPGLLRTPREGLLEVVDGRIVALNRAAARLLGQPLDALLDRSVEELLGRAWHRFAPSGALLTLADGRQFTALVEPARERPVQIPGAALRTADAAESTTRREPGEEAAADALAPLLQRAVRVLDAGVAVLVCGETGSGKEVFAKRLHAASRRAAGPFVTLDCAALPESLIEAELFGYEAGTFTGARRQGMPGRIREAEGGVLFLDEIGDMPLSLQTRLLRVLEDRAVTPLGGGRRVPVDFALVSASHRDLPSRVRDGSFRADLLYRLQGYTVEVPPLRARADRSRVIEEVFARAGATDKRLRLHPQALDALAAHDWPGNVRELANLLRTLVALSEPGEVLATAALPAAIAGRCPEHPGADACGGGPRDARPDDLRPARATPPGAEAPATLAASTRQAFDAALRECGGQIGDAARRLGVHRSTVYRYLRSRERAG